MDGLIQRYHKQILGTLGCFDRVVLTGTLPKVCHAKGMASILFERDVLIRDYVQFAQALRDRIRQNAEQLAQDAGVEIQFIRKRNFRQKDRIEAILRTRGRHVGLVHIFSVIETCTAYKPWFDKASGHNTLRPDFGKCLHYYFYFIDEHFGLCHLRVPTWCPFALQFYFNGHDWLARQLDRHEIGYQQVDNAIVQCDDWAAAQRLADAFNAEHLHRTADRYAAQYCPVLKDLGQRYHWSIHQAEYATDVVFRRREDLQPLYEALVETSVHAVKAADVATFLGRKLHGHYQGEVGNRYQVRIEGTRIRHHMGRDAAIKMYDKLGHILRIETTVIDVRFFKHYREVEHRDGTSSMKQAPLRKSIYSLPALQELCRAANRRYLAFLSELDDRGPRLKPVQKVAETRRAKGRCFRGFNLLSHGDYSLFLAIARGEFRINGLTNRAIRRVLPGYSGSQMSRILKRLRMHGILKKIGRTYKYYLTRAGRAVLAAAVRLRDRVTLPVPATAQTQ